MRTAASGMLYVVPLSAGSAGIDGLAPGVPARMVTVTAWPSVRDTFCVDTVPAVGSLTLRVVVALATSTVTDAYTRSQRGLPLALAAKDRVLPSVPPPALTKMPLRMSRQFWSSAFAPTATLEPTTARNGLIWM